MLPQRELAVGEGRGRVRGGAQCEAQVVRWSPPRVRPPLLTLRPPLALHVMLQSLMLTPTVLSELDDVLSASSSRLDMREAWECGWGVSSRGGSRWKSVGVMEELNNNSACL